MTLTDWTVVLPVALALGGTALCAVFWWRPVIQSAIGIVITLLMLVSAGVLVCTVATEGPQTMAMSGWPGPFGIVFAVDLLGAGLAFVTALVGLLILIYNFGDQSSDYRRVGYTPLLLAMLAGVSGAFLTGDIFNLYVWFEVLIIGSFGLLILGGKKAQLDGAIKYATLNLLATTFFLIATGLLYGLTGTLNMADLASKVAAVDNRALVNVVAALYLLAFGMKAAAFPLFFWLPASYHTPKPGVSAVFAGLLTKVGVYALYRVFTLIFPASDTIFADLLIWIAGATILAGGLGAIAQTDIRRLVAFTVVGGIGYMLVGLALQSPLALTGGLFYIFHSMLISTALFLAVGIAGRLGGSYDIAKLGGLYRARPAFAMMFLVVLFAVAGVPPFSGFWPKVVLVQASLAADAPWLAGVILVGGFLTLVAVARAFAAAFWDNGEEEPPRATHYGDRVGALMLPTLVIIGLSVLMGLAAEPVVQLAGQAAAGLSDPSAYIEAVLGGSE